MAQESEIKISELPHISKVEVETPHTIRKYFLTRLTSAIPVTIITDGLYHPRFLNSDPLIGAVVGGVIGMFIGGMIGSLIAEVNGGGAEGPDGCIPIPIGLAAGGTCGTIIGAVIFS